MKNLRFLAMAIWLLLNLTLGLLLSPNLVGLVRVNAQEFNWPPVADAGGPYSYSEGELIAFDGSDSYDIDGSIVSWHWNFGDEPPQYYHTGQNPYHTYLQDGTYTVTLNVTDDDSATDVAFATAYIYDIDPIANFSASPLSGPKPLTVTFSDASSSYDGIESWLWQFGDGQTSTEQNPSHVYNEEGSYTVRLTVTEFDGDTDIERKNRYIDVTTPPVADAGGPYEGIEGLSISFDGSGSYDPDGTIISYYWDFGDGGTSLNPNPIHGYDQDDTYTVTLTVTDNDGETSTDTTYAIVADIEPVADFSASPLSGPKPLTVTFSDASSSYDGIESWLWQFDDGQTSTEQNPSHVYDEEGTYTVRLVVTELDGDTHTETKTDYITVEPPPNSPPIADFNIQSSAKPAINEEIQFIDESSDVDGTITSWFWTFGDGNTSTAQNPTHKYRSQNTFTITLTVEDDDAAKDTTTKQITIYDINPPLTTDNYDGLWHTSDFTITLVASDDYSGVAETYYTINGGPIIQLSINDQPQITTESANNKLEYWSIDNAGNEETHHTSLNIKLDKTNPIANAGQDITVNEDTLIILNGSRSTDNIEITNYIWSLFDGTPQTLEGANPQYTFNTPGVYTAILSVTDAALNSASDALTITVIDITKPTANAGDDQVVHEGLEVTFDGSNSTDNMEIVIYSWDFIDVTPQHLVGINPTYTFKTAGIYEVTLTVSDAQGNYATDGVTVTVIDATWPAANAGPDQNVLEDTTVYFDGSASSDNVGITSFVWTFNDTTPQTLYGVNPSYFFGTPGVYLVTLNVSDAEGYSSTDTVTIIVQEKPGDISTPTILITSPENTTYTTNTIPLMFNVNKEPTVKSYSLDGKANTTIVDTINLSNLSDGEHYLVMYAEDLAGNIGVSNVVVFTITSENDSSSQLWIVGVIGAIAGLGFIFSFYIAYNLIKSRHT